MWPQTCTSQIENWTLTLCSAPQRELTSITGHRITEPEANPADGLRPSASCVHFIQGVHLAVRLHNLGRPGGVTAGTLHTVVSHEHTGSTARRGFLLEISNCQLLTCPCKVPSPPSAAVSTGCRHLATNRFDGLGSVTAALFNYYYLLQLGCTWWQ
jgi:hypothetical protein